MPASQRSRELESEQTRRTILAAAEELLSSGGERGLSIREVCAKARVTPPTIYHHFGDKDALIDRVLDECFEAFDGAFLGRTAPADPVERLRWGFDRYVEYGLAHPTHYRLMFLRSREHPSAGGLASYDRLRRMVAAIEAAGRLLPPLEAATAAFWASVHGVTSLLVAGFWKPESPAIALVRDAMIAELTTERARRAKKKRRRP